jgi:hypothetical protein
MVMPTGVPEAPIERLTGGADDTAGGAGEEGEGEEGEEEEGEEEEGDGDDAGGGLAEEQAAKPNRTVRSRIRAFISTRTVPVGPARRIQERHSFKELES